MAEGKTLVPPTSYRSVSTLHAPHQQELEILQAILSIFYTWNFGALNEVLGLIEVDI